MAIKYEIKKQLGAISTSDNGWIKELTEEYNLKYLNTNPSLKDSDGYLQISYQNGDGIHLNRSGFEAVLNYIRTHGYPKN